MQEKRRQGSIRVARPLEIEYRANCPPIRARIEDISETGFFLDSTNMLQVGSALEFVLQLPGEQGGAPIHGKGRVTWIQEMVGAGVEFVALKQDEKDRIRYFVASVFFGQAD